MNEIIEKELNLFKLLKSPMVRNAFVFTYPVETKKKYPEYFVI